MSSSQRDENLKLGEDSKAIFQKAYENRYTWDKTFSGYKGNCSWENGVESLEGDFILSKDFKVNIANIHNPLIVKAISSQLWEVAIHRVRRPFEEVHGKNTFRAGDYNEIGIEILVGGKNEGDKYRVKDNVITMVYRNIHGNLINIFTKDIINTETGYLSREYTSQYLDPDTKREIKPKNKILDNFRPLFNNGPFVLTEREIKTVDSKTLEIDIQVFKFFNLSQI
tara:strand:+ start:788 stop:1462 length:675 start_codon:yes stop_codon:yes gene_type:complete